MPHLDRFQNGMLLAFVLLLTTMTGADDKPVAKPNPPDLRLVGAEVTDAAVDKLAGKDWGTVTIADARFTGHIAESFRHTRSIQTLRLMGTDLSGQLPRLKNVNGLKGLEIQCPLTGHDLDALGSFTQLVELTLPQESTINVTGAREIAQLTNLKKLNLYNVNIDDASFVELSPLTNLEELDLTHTRVTDEGLRTLEQMPRLRNLMLNRHPDWHIKQQLTDACAPTISQLAELEMLSISGKITNAGLEKIAKLPRLKWLMIYGTEVTPDGLAALEKSRVESLIMSWDQIPIFDDNRLNQFGQTLRTCRSLKHITVIGKFISQDAIDKLTKIAPQIGWGFQS